MRRDRRRQKQGERLGAILGLLTGGIGGFLKQVREREAADLERQKEERLAKQAGAELDLKTKQEERLGRSAEGLAALRDAQRRKAEKDIAAGPKTAKPRAKTALDHEVASFLQTQGGGDLEKAISAITDSIQKSQTGMDALDPGSFDMMGQQQNLSRLMQIHGALMGQRPDILGSGDYQITRNEQMPPQQTGMAEPQQQQQPGFFDMQSDLVGAMLDAYNPQNPPELRMMGMAKLRKYLGPDAVLQSFKNQMGGPPVPSQMPR